ncbi:hypothetical protein AOQ88_01065 [Candidatus Riesia sp. GBBU]|nr:hypothetical protein AOQ88_01065 [Candidatus Riesia sp. GBBU]
MIFGKTNMRTNYCGEIDLSYIGRRVVLCGWVSSYRNINKIIFVNLRDCYGIIQITFSNIDVNLFKKAKKLRNEYCIQVSGIIKKRKKPNRNLLTGNVELSVSSLKIINKSDPVPINLEKENSEEIRIKYRYLELRKKNMLKNLFKRSEIINFTKDFMKSEKFMFIETPILTRSSKEGARDYIVPSRIHKSKFYALPQSPQLFKQILMISGVDRYYQIAKCFRDEDLRSDRQPEFTQIDIEMSFVNSKQVRSIMQKFIKHLWRKFKKYEFDSFPSITFNESMTLYGTDKPDLRNPLKLNNVSKFFNKEKIISKYNFEDEATIISIFVDDKHNNIKMCHMDKYKCLSKKFGVKEFFCIKLDSVILENEKYNKIFQFISKNSFTSMISKFNSKKYNLAFFCFDKKEIVYKFMGFFRKKIWKDLKIKSKNVWKPVWITDFPMFSINKDGKLCSVHHPFTSPKCLNDLYTTNPTDIISDSYDMVINGYEVGSGSSRIFKKKIQEKVFELIGVDEKQKNNQFNYLIEALKYGAPPHAGFAFGLDRLVMLIVKSKNIKDVIAFPKTTEAVCTMTDSPSKVSNKLLNDLSLKIG